MPKRSEHFKADRREEILAAATRCFLARGYDRTTMREIATEAGVSTGAIYVYFHTKAEILDATCLERSARERTELREALAHLPPGVDPLTAGLSVVLQPYLAATAAERQERERLSLMMLYEATREPAFAASMREICGSWRSLTEAILREEQSAGRIAADLDLDALADVLMALPFGLEIVELLGGKEFDWSAIIRTLSRVLWPGMATVAALRDAVAAGAVPADVLAGAHGSG
jgi:AcrR family transcriptional regulator